MIDLPNHVSNILGVGIIDDTYQLEHNELFVCLDTVTAANHVSEYISKHQPDTYVMDDRGELWYTSIIRIMLERLGLPRHDDWRKILTYFAEYFDTDDGMKAQNQDAYNHPPTVTAHIMQGGGVSVSLRQVDPMVPVRTNTAPLVLHAGASVETQNHTRGLVGEVSVMKALPVSVISLCMDAMGERVDTIPILAVVPNAFVYHTSLAKVDLRGSGIQRIGSHAFSMCSNLCEIHLPETLVHLEAHSFVCCSALKEVTLPPLVETVGEHVFVNCTSLQRLDMSACIVKQIPTFFLIKCSALTELKLPQELTDISEYAFYDCALENIRIPRRVPIREWWKWFHHCTRLWQITLASFHKESSPPLSPHSSHYYDYVFEDME